MEEVRAKANISKTVNKEPKVLGEASGEIKLKAKGLRFYKENKILQLNLLGWPKSPFRFFFYKIKDTFFVFTNNFIDLDSLSMSAISCIVEH